VSVSKFLLKSRKKTNSGKSIGLVYDDEIWSSFYSIYLKPTSVNSVSLTLSVVIIPSPFMSWRRF